MPNKLKKCSVCKAYTLKSEHCDKKTIDAHYKYVKIKDVIKTGSFEKSRS